MQCFNLPFQWCTKIFKLKQSYAQCIPYPLYLCCLCRLSTCRGGRLQGRDAHYLSYFCAASSYLGLNLSIKGNRKHKCTGKMVRSICTLQSPCSCSPGQSADAAPLLPWRHHPSPHWHGSNEIKGRQTQLTKGSQPRTFWTNNFFFILFFKELLGYFIGGWWWHLGQSYWRFPKSFMGIKYTDITLY